MNNPIVIFDGVCNLCDSTVQFIIRNDKKRIFRFTPAQSDFAKEIVQKHNLNSVAEKTVILIYNNRAYKRSSAILKILMLLGYYWKVMALPLHIIPPVILDLAYKFISNHRYKWFGRKESCMIPNDDILDRFF